MFIIHQRMYKPMIILKLLVTDLIKDQKLFFVENIPLIVVGM